MFLKKSLLHTILALFLLATLVACDKERSREKLYLEHAKSVALEKDWPEVISQLQKFIAIEDQASIEDKREAWILMADATASLGQIRESAEILELMIQDADYDARTRVEIYGKLVRLYDRVHNWEKAADTRVKIIKYSDMDADEVARLLLQAGLNYQNIRKYRKSDEVLDVALQRVQDPSLKAEIYYHRAYGKTVFKEMNAAENYLIEALKSDSINDEIKGQIYYLLGDIFEYRNKYAIAYDYYEEALDLYPNKMFVQKRLDFLEKNHKKYLKPKKNTKNNTDKSDNSKNTKK